MGQPPPKLAENRAFPTNSHGVSQHQVLIEIKSDRERTQLQVRVFDPEGGRGIGHRRLEIDQSACRLVGCETPQLDAFRLHRTNDPTGGNCTIDPKHPKQCQDQAGCDE